MSVGGNHPDDLRWFTTDGAGIGDILQRYADEYVGKPTICLAFGADSVKDKEAAEALARVVPARLIAVSVPNDSVGHNALHPLLKRGELAGLLNSTVFAKTHPSSG